MININRNEEQDKIVEKYKKDYLKLYDNLPPLKDKNFSSDRQKPLLELRKKFMQDMEDASDQNKGKG